MKSFKDLTVITGSSQGLGKAFATTCAKLGRDLALVSLPNEGLEETARQLKSQYGVKVICFETDLTKTENISRLVQDLSQYEISMLINNAGMGGTKKFLDASMEYIENMIFLNMRCLVMLTHQIMPLFKKEGQNYILNIGSLAAFSPMPYKTIYPASKSFVTSFSRGLYAELKGTNIHVAVACPGGLATNLDVAARIGNHRGLVKRSILTADEAANICIKELFKKKYVIIPGRLNRFSSFLQRTVPVRLQMKLMAGKLEKEMLPVA